MYVYVCLSVCMYMYVSVCLYACLYVCMYMSVCVCMYMSVCVYVCVYVHVCMCLYMYVCNVAQCNAHTHTHDLKIHTKQRPVGFLQTTLLSQTDDSISQ